ncbi:hypothetical protein MMC22_004898 [Lobaria immixta]|nr:hypothetical protein [Lobaria immixta]
MSTSVVSLASTVSSKTLSEESIQILRLRNDHYSVKNGQETVEIPEYLESLETFKSLEINETTAQTLWQLYCQMLSDDPDRCDVLKIAKYHVRTTPGDVGQEGDDWVGHMDQIGLTRRFQARLIAPEAQEMREMASANEWAILMMTMRYEFLEDLDAIIKTPSKGVKRPTSRITPSGEQWKIGEGGLEIPERGSSKGSSLRRENSRRAHPPQSKPRSHQRR